ncbi:hypothetical protein PUN28_009761 [Cardiocondyla obscurior]|uniref:Uncharacterized protein n=1 Tax=Cardiocondyla obscurior TaxID=286306 RepID=A0AAW2FR70_9HYME
MQARHKHLPDSDPAGMEEPNSVKLAARRRGSLGSSIPIELCMNTEVGSQDPGLPRRRKVRRGRRKPQPKDASSPDSTTGPLTPRVIAVEIFPPGQPLLIVRPKPEPPAATGPPPSQPVQPLLPRGLPPVALRPWYRAHCGYHRRS